MNTPCEGSGVQAIGTKCNQFVNCVNGNGFIQTCGPGTVFHSTLKVCVHSWQCNNCCLKVTYTQPTIRPVATTRRTTARPTLKSTTMKPTTKATTKTTTKQTTTTSTVKRTTTTTTTTATTTTTTKTTTSTTEKRESQKQAMFQKLAMVVGVDKEFIGVKSLISITVRMIIQMQITIEELESKASKCAWKFGSVSVFSYTIKPLKNFEKRNLKWSKLKCIEWKYQFKYWWCHVVLYKISFISK